MSPPIRSHHQRRERVWILLHPRLHLNSARLPCVSLSRPWRNRADRRAFDSVRAVRQDLAVSPSDPRDAKWLHVFPLRGARQAGALAHDLHRKLNSSPGEAISSVRRRAVSHQNSSVHGADEYRSGGGGGGPTMGRADCSHLSRASLSCHALRTTKLWLLDHDSSTKERLFPNRLLFVVGLGPLSVSALKRVLYQLAAATVRPRPLALKISDRRSLLRQLGFIQCLRCVGRSASFPVLSIKSR